MFFSSFSLSLALSVLFSLLVGLMQCILLFRDFSRLLLNQSHGLLSVHSMPLNHIRRRKVLISWNLHWIRSDFKPKNSIFKLFFSWFWNDTHPSLNLIFLAWITNIEKTRSSELFFRVQFRSMCAWMCIVHVRAYLFVRSSLILRSTFIRRSLNRSYGFSLSLHFHRLDALNYNVNTNLWLQISYAFIAFAYS